MFNAYFHKSSGLGANEMGHVKNGDGHRPSALFGRPVAMLKFLAGDKEMVF
jgi:hypothetical protein